MKPTNYFAIKVETDMPRTQIHTKQQIKNQRKTDDMNKNTESNAFRRKLRRKQNLKEIKRQKSS